MRTRRQRPHHEVLRLDQRMPRAQVDARDACAVAEERGARTRIVWVETADFEETEGAGVMRQGRGGGQELVEPCHEHFAGVAAARRRLACDAGGLVAREAAVGAELGGEALGGGGVAGAEGVGVGFF